MMARGVVTNRFWQVLAILAAALFLFALATCGGGGGGKKKSDKVTIIGVVDDGNANAVVNASCSFVDDNGKTITTADCDSNGTYQLQVSPGVTGYILCGPKNMESLNLSTVVSTVGMAAGATIPSENVTPTTTVAADIIRYETPPDLEIRKIELVLRAQTDPDLKLVVAMAGRLYRAMVARNVDARFGNNRGGDGGEGGEGNRGDSGGVGGDAGDGADFSPLIEARCSFVIGDDFSSAEQIYPAALADFLDGVLDRPDLADLVDDVLDGESPDVISRAFEAWFPDDLWEELSVLTDQDGKYFLRVPANLEGYVHCVPKDRQKLVLGTHVAGRSAGDVIGGQDVNPATTVFSAVIATQLEKDLDKVKENFLDDIKDLKVKLDWPDYPDGSLEGFNVEFSEDTDREVGLVAFSATALFNTFYKNSLDVDFLAALADLSAKRDIDPGFLAAQGVSTEQVEILTESIDKAEDTDYLNTTLGKALSTARVHVIVENADGLVPGADVTIGNDDVQCKGSCSQQTNGDGQVILTLIDVPQTATAVEVRVSGVPGYEEVRETVAVVAFATVDLEISLQSYYSIIIARGGGDGSGTVSSVPGEIACDIDNATEGGTCRDTFPSGTQVTLTATPDETSAFSSWSGGGCSGTNQCTVTMDQAHTVTATFTLIPSPEYLLTVIISGDGTGTVTSNPSGISCSTNSQQDTHDYEDGTRVTLTASPDDESTFDGWNGGGCSGTSPCTVTMDQARTITATFVGPTQGYRLTLSKLGEGRGTVTSNPSGISCMPECAMDSHDFEEGSSVILTASPASGSTFDGWSSGCSGTGTCTVTMSQALTVTARFTPITLVISGTVGSSEGTAISGVTVTFNNNGGTATTNSSGAYTRTVLYGWSGTATPSLSGYSFDPESISYSSVRSNQANQNYTGCTAPSAPGSISYPSSDDDGSFTVSWTSVSGATSYALQRATNATFTGATTVHTGPSTSYSQTGLGTGTYYYRVRAENGCGNSSYRTGSAISVCIAPSAPGSISYPSSDDNGSFTVSWTSVSGATSYALQRATNASFTGATTVHTGSSTSYSQTGLGTGTYYYRVRAENGCGNSSYRTGSAISVCIAPSRPISISYPSSDCDGSFTVDWPSVSGATSYALQRATNASFSNATTVYTGSSTSDVQTGLGTGTYYYRVRANNSCGSSSYRTGGAVTVSTAPSGPGSISYPSSDGDGSFTVSWSSVSGATSYTLQRATNYWFGDATTAYTGSSTSYSETGLVEGTYYYRVRANNSCGNSSYREGSGIWVQGDVTGEWDLEFDWDCDGDPGSTTWDLNDNHTFMSGDSGPGTWSLDGSQITLTYDSGAVYRGTVSGDQMEGSMYSDNEREGCWRASRGANVLSFRDSINGGESSAGASGSPPSR